MSLNRKERANRTQVNTDWPEADFIDNGRFSQDKFNRWYEQWKDAMNLKLQSINDAKQDR